MSAAGGSSSPAVETERRCGECGARGFPDFGEHLRREHADEELDVWVCQCGFSAETFDAVVHHCHAFGHCPSKVARRFDQHLLQLLASVPLDIVAKAPTPPLPPVYHVPLDAAPRKPGRKRGSGDHLDRAGQPAVKDAEQPLQSLVAEYRKPKVPKAPVQIPREMDALAGVEDALGSTSGVAKGDDIGTVISKIEYTQDGLLMCPLCKPGVPGNPQSKTVFRTIGGVNCHLFQHHGIKKGRVNYCQVCEKWFQSLGAYHSHKRSAHPEVTKKSRIKCGLCEHWELKVVGLVTHVAERHGVPCRAETLAFPSAEAYEAWAIRHQALRGLKRKGMQLTSSKGTTTYYVCLHSYCRKSPEEADYFTCTAFMNVQQLLTGGFTVHFCLQHYNH